MELKTRKSVRPRTTVTTIGNVQYVVTAHFNEKGQTAEQIISRLISDRVEEEIKNAEQPSFQRDFPCNVQNSTPYYG
jgi:hypothetical protein